MQSELSGGTQIKVTLPPHLYAALRQESKDAAVTMADLVRLAIKERYERQLQDWRTRQSEANSTEATQ